MQKIVFLLLTLAVMALAAERVDTFPKCSAPTLVAPSYGFEQWTAKCWADNAGNSDLTSGKPDAAMCDCYNKFSDANWALCSMEAQFEYKAYLKNNCVPAAKSTWTFTDMIGEWSIPPCQQSCALKQPSIFDVCTIAEKCTDVSTCHWDEALHLHNLKASCKPACTLDVMSDCITANKLSSASYCEILEACQPVYYNSPYQFSLASVPPGASQKCEGDVETLEDMDTVMEYRRLTCACPHGYVKAPNEKRCDAKLREATVITISQELRSDDGNLLFWQTNKALQDRIRLFIGRRIFATDIAKAAGIFENDETNLKELVKITKIELAPSVTTAIAQSRRALSERELVQGDAPDKNAGEGTGVGVKITYTVSVENKAVWPTLSGLAKDNSVSQNIQQYVTDVVAYAPLKNTVGWTRSADLFGQADVARNVHTAGLSKAEFLQTANCAGDKLDTKCLTTSGSGTGAKLEITTGADGIISDLKVSSAGQNYAVSDKLTLTTNGVSTVFVLTKVGPNGEVVADGDPAYWASPKDVTSAFAEALTSEIKSTASCGVNFDKLCTKTWAAYTGAPSSGVVTVERFSPPTAAPTFAPTPRADYVASPIVMFSAAGGVAVLLFGFFCVKAHISRAPAKKSEKVTRPAVTARAAPAAAAPAGGVQLTMPPPAPTNAEVAAKQTVKPGRA